MTRTGTTTQNVTGGLVVTSKRFTTYIEIPVTVAFDYQPHEKKTLNYPGCDEDADVTEVTFSDVNIKPLLSSITLEQIRLEALDYIHALMEPEERE